MISVIVPTMWKALEYTKPMLQKLDNHPLIGEIILIDNDTSKTDHEFLNQLSKLTYVSFEQGNIFVNPAWNHGAKIAKFDKLFIINDDVLINLIQLNQIYEQITPDKGMIGFSFLCYCTYTLDAYETLCNSGFGDEITIAPIDPREFPRSSGMPHPFYGSAYFIHKQSYYDVPDEFKIHYGDLYIYLSNLKNGNANYVIEDGLVMTQYSSTVSSDFAKKILNHEAEILKDVFAKHGLKDIRYNLI